ncbi:DNA polymerase II participates in chromosomal DNA replication-like protein [Thermochaetoides thermophila DSM 1495]|uniref:NCT transcriptional regulatory complex subunit A n=1 Tax=Chaetomium thermophilum (strain DSM 1495 / CBS 144.50 / IMI 039719) TaxID=759272 RepID=G0S4E9_CHATD|nr:DNA polymerase II participates in chromosomal DNA replication-like protein [Thermochaetoides thermophila DSM 1495]EGS20427.1 DNA polymerase II participates in chromosomal DNA replication-like protein [Thermochaetoides thermophila DSM 1495]
MSDAAHDSGGGYAPRSPDLSSFHNNDDLAVGPTPALVTERAPQAPSGQQLAARGFFGSGSQHHQQKQQPSTSHPGPQEPNFSRPQLHTPANSTSPYFPDGGHQQSHALYHHHNAHHTHHRSTSQHEYHTPFTTPPHFQSQNYRPTNNSNPSQATPVFDVGVAYSHSLTTQREYIPPCVPAQPPYQQQLHQQQPSYYQSPTSYRGSFQQHHQQPYQPPQQFSPQQPHYSTAAAQAHQPYSYTPATSAGPTQQASQPDEFDQSSAMPPRRAAAAAAAAAVTAQAKNDAMTDASGTLTSTATTGTSSSASGSTANGAIQPGPVKTKFPTARIKRIMQADEEVGKVAQQTPIAVGKALELFMVALVTKSAELARQRNSKRVSAQMLKQVVESDDQWDFLRDIVSKVENDDKEKGGRGGGGAGGRANKAAESESEDESGMAKKKRGGGRRKKVKE